MKALIYGRYSTIDQAEGGSEERQLEMARAFCKRHGWPVDEEMIDRGLSGFHGRNAKGKANLAKVLERVASGKLGKGHVLVFENWDRFSRQEFKVVYPRVLALLEKGLILATVAPESVLTLENIDDPGVLVQFLFEVLRGAGESGRKSKMLAKHWQKFRDTMKPGMQLPCRPPSWIEWDGERYVKVPAQVDKINRLVKLTLDGVSVRGCMRTLNGMGILSTAGKQWNVPTIKRILTSRSLLGFYQPKRRIKEVKVKDGIRMDREPVGEEVKMFPHVLTEEEFQRVQGKLCKIARKGRTTAQCTNLFTGLLHCKQDDSPAVVSLGGRKPSGNASPTLYSRGKWRGVSDTPAFPYRHFEEAFLKWFKECTVAELTGDIDATEEIKDAEARVGRATGQVAEVEAARNSGDLPYSAYLKELGKCQRELDAAQNALVAARGKSLLGRAAADHRETKNLIELQAKHKGAALVEIRERIKGRIAILMQRVDFTIIKDGNMRFGGFEVLLASGVKRLLIVLVRGMTSNAQCEALCCDPEKELPAGKLAEATNVSRFVDMLAEMSGIS